MEDGKNDLEGRSIACFFGRQRIRFWTLNEGPGSGQNDQLIGSSAESGDRSEERFGSGSATDAAEMSEIFPARLFVLNYSIMKVRPSNVPQITVVTHRLRHRSP